MPLALIWAIFGKIDVVATAAGKTVPGGNVKIVQPIEIGAVRAIHVRNGQFVKKGDLLLEMDLDKIAAAAHPAVVITVITNTDDFKDVEVVASGVVEPGADLIKISK